MPERRPYQPFRKGDARRRPLHGGPSAGWFPLTAPTTGAICSVASRDTRKGRATFELLLLLLIVGRIKGNGSTNRSV